MERFIYLLLGSNLGDREHNLAQARQAISRQIGPIITTSFLYQTEAWGKTGQPDFYNQVLQVESGLTAKAGLQVTSEIEDKMGRKRHEKWGPRTLDIDILFWGDQIITTPELTVPHPALARRRFTLVPLNEIASDFIHPVLQKTVKILLEECEDNLAVEKLT